jgi:DNA-binding transcriptional LysR family regulator
MQLTAAGEELLKMIIGPLRQLDQAFQTVRTSANELSGEIAFGMPPTVSYVLAAPLAVRLAQEAPNVSLRIVEGYAGYLIEWLQRGEIDAAILYGPAADLKLSASDLLREELVLVGPAKCELRPEESISLSGLANLPLVLPSHPHGLRIAVDNLAAKAKVALAIRFQADSFALMKDMVEAGLGYTVLPLSSFSREFAAGRLQYAPIVQPRATRQLILAAGTGGPSRYAEILGSFVRAEIADLVISQKWHAELLFEPAKDDE